MPQRKKDPSVRARRNKAASKATLLRPAPTDATEAGALEAMTVAQLRAAIDVRNQSRPADQQLPRSGRKAELIELLAAAARPVPSLPAHPPRIVDDVEIPVEWHGQTVAWWNDAWTSPMAQEWDESDLHNMAALALVYDDIWSATSARERKEALSEYRLQRADLGLSPYSRRRLEWTIETADEAKARGDKRRGNGRVPTAAAAGKPAVDPRTHLSAVPS